MARLTRVLEPQLRKLKKRLPEGTVDHLMPLYRRGTAWPPGLSIRFGSLNRTEPISRQYGFDRGQPIDRMYIERFLRKHTVENGTRNPVRGRVLEIGEDRYASRYAADEGIGDLDLLDIDRDNPVATVFADLADAPELKTDAYDCVICTQTLLLIFEVRAAVETLHRTLRPGGTLLVTVPGISQICQPEMSTEGDFWRFTTKSLERLLTENFPADETVVESYGNVKSAAAFLYGLAADDLTDAARDRHDDDYQLIIGARCVKR